MQLIHSLPGTTFSNIYEKGSYPSDKKAVLTLSELEYWLTLAIIDYYHQKIHQGFILDHIAYNSSVLTPLIAARKKYQQFLIRRDPRDLSFIYVLEPHSNRYLEIPYRTLSRPTITLWEHRRAIEWLNNKGINRLNETF